MPAHRQVLPNRRFRRLFPVAVVSAALATSAVAGPPAAQAKTHRVPHAGSPTRVVTVPTAAPTRGTTPQPKAAS